jgi:phenylalanyl-tRNA synthetase alpha chain
LKKKGWASIRNKKVEITEKGKRAFKEKGKDEEAIELLGEKKEKEIPKDMAEQLKKRNAIKEREKISRLISLTDEGKLLLKRGIKIKEEVSQLTPELIKSGKWKDAILRPYDIKTFAPTIYIGKRHPLSRLIDEIRKIFFEMGFTEIEGGYVESCFWNMDALFIPQDHPARDLQDTFYCNQSMEIDEKLLNLIARVHEDGGKTGSKGWEYKFSKKEAKKAILRTHTTANTIRYLYKNPKPPAKVFIIGKVFRKENLDKTHLPEFHQIEGIVHEKGANLRQLIGILKEFYNRVGFKEIRMRPAYFPYTEPSIEVEVKWHKKWIELGGSGIFRPEVIEPIGIKEPVLAWGLGLERLAMMLLGLDDIRDLYMSDIKWLREMPLL